MDLTNVQLDAHTGISSIAQEILDLGAKVWAEIEEKYGRITPKQHGEIERRVDECLKEKFPTSKWHSGFAGKVTAYTAMLETHLRAKSSSPTDQPN